MSTEKKVLVSGCFDLLHSGHVEFFRDAAKHGKLYVRIGADANIQALKHHKPMYSESERLFMVKNIKWVYDAAVSKGSGVYDFETDMKEIKPDIYFVNEDASKMEGRIKICKDLGIEMKIAPRKPSEGLETRSSTSMKSRLREMIASEEKSKVASAGKKVLVSGCFDLLHSGHVQFFHEASQHGLLYVRIGSDKNIEALKHHKPMYSEEERLFMVKNIKGVFDAGVSKGSGVYDFETDMKEIKPDFYFVNEDGSKMDGRVKICKELGIKMIIAPRKPNEGLAVRSSTSMKARMKEMLLEEGENRESEVKKQELPVSAFNKVYPWRFCFAGGWMDLAWCNALHPGCAVTINIKYNPKICRDYCGLATSSRKVAIKLWNGRIPVHLEPEKAARLLWGAENFDAFATRDRPYIAGSQDHCGLFFPGVNKLCYKDGKHWPFKIINLNDTKDAKQQEIFKWLESVLHIVDIPFVSRPKGYSSQTINYLKDPKVSHFDKVRMVKALSDASELAWDSIVKMDVDKLGKALSDTMKAWGTMLPYTVNPHHGDEAKSMQLKQFVSKYDRPNTKGCLFSGAGGGFLMVINDKPVENGIKISINHDPICRPHPSDKI